MPEPYDLTNATSANNLGDIFVAANQLTNHLLGSGLLMFIWIVIFISLKNYYTKYAAFAASTITMFSSIMFFLIGIIGQPVLMAVILIFAINLIWVMME